MPTIKFSDKELEYIRESYLAELKAAIEYLEKIRHIIAKLGSSNELLPEAKGTLAAGSKKRKRRRKPRQTQTPIDSIGEIVVTVEKKKRGRPRREKKMEIGQKEAKTAKKVSRK
jgi:hypothetical protein